MKKQNSINRFKLVFVMLSVLSTTTYGQSVLILDQPESGEQEHCAGTTISLQPGYSYTPVGSEKMQAYILASCILPTFVPPKGVLDKKLDGGYYLVAGGILKFKYNEEYNINTSNDKLTYGIYDESQTQILAVNENSTPIVTGSPLIQVSYGVNQFEIDLGATPATFVAGDYYTLEVVNDKKEKWYLRFQYN